MGIPKSQIARDRRVAGQLMTFAKCQTGKYLINYIDITRYSRDML
jgi:hypothetical protein